MGLSSLASLTMNVDVPMRIRIFAIRPLGITVRPISVASKTFFTKVANRSGSVTRK
jgi:hypothetical protein